MQRYKFSLKLNNIPPKKTLKTEGLLALIIRGFRRFGER
jgi:hypothetical protein